MSESGPYESLDDSIDAECIECGLTATLDWRLDAFGAESYIEVTPPGESNIEFFEKGDCWRCAECTEGSA